jgi:ankyrin repeat protein
MNPNQELIKAAEKGDLEQAKAALGEGADINFHSDSEWAPIIHAARNGHLRMVKFLIEQGANMNIENPYKETARCLAGSPEVKEFLAKLGARP